MSASETWAAHILSVLSVNKRVSKSMMACSLGTFVSNPKFVDVLGQLESADRILIGWDEALGTVLTLADAPESPHAAPKPSDTATRTTEPSECSTGQARPVADDVDVDRHMERLLAELHSVQDGACQKTPESDTGWNLYTQFIEAVTEFGEEYHAMREEVAQLRKQLRIRMEANAACYQSQKEAEELKAENKKLWKESNALRKQVEEQKQKLFQSVADHSAYLILKNKLRDLSHE